MSRKKKITAEDSPDTTEIDARAESLVDGARALVGYIRNAERTTGVANTPHGPVLVLDPEQLNVLVSALETALTPEPEEPAEPEPEVEVVSEPEPPTYVSGEAGMSGKSGMDV